MSEQIQIETLSNGKAVCLEGNEITQEEALELAKKLVNTWGRVHRYAKAVIFYEVEPRVFSECPHYGPTEEGLKRGLESEGYEGPSKAIVDKMVGEGKER